MRATSVGFVFRALQDLGAAGTGCLVYMWLKPVPEHLASLEVAAAFAASMAVGHFAIWSINVFMGSYSPFESLHYVKVKCAISGVVGFAALLATPVQILLMAARVAPIAYRPVLFSTVAPLGLIVFVVQFAHAWREPR